MDKISPVIHCILCIHKLVEYHKKFFIKYKFLFYKRTKWDTEKLSNLSKITELVSTSGLNPTKCNFSDWNQNYDAMSTLSLLLREIVCIIFYNKNTLSDDVVNYIYEVSVMCVQPKYN